MINAVTQETLYLILPYKVGQLAADYARRAGISLREALRYVYSSRTYEDLQTESTKLWHLGPVALLQHLLEYH